MNALDFIKHDETPFMGHLTAAPIIILGAPEVLTDVALLCVEEKPYPSGGGKINKQCRTSDFNLAITIFKASVKRVTRCKIQYYFVKNEFTNCLDFIIKLYILI